jgi:puromycin-sensitive aminopeptidase
MPLLNAFSFHFIPFHSISFLFSFLVVQVHNAGLMKTRTMTVNVPASAGAKWVRLNAGQHVPMRVFYSNPANLASLRAAIEKKQMDTEDRAGLVMDALALTQAGRLDASELVRLLSVFKQEDTLAVWTAIEKALTGLSGVLADGKETHKAFVNFAKTLVAGAAARVGWTKKGDDGHLSALLRTILIRLQGSFMSDDFLTMAQATARFNAFMVAPKSAAATVILPTDLRLTVFRLVLAGAKGVEVAWRLSQLHSLLKMATTVAERIVVYAAIGSVPTEEARTAVLDWTISGEVSCLCSKLLAMCIAACCDWLNARNSSLMHQI